MNARIGVINTTSDLFSMSVWKIDSGQLLLDKRAKHYETNTNGGL